MGTADADGGWWRPAGNGGCLFCYPLPLLNVSGLVLRSPSKPELLRTLMLGGGGRRAVGGTQGWGLARSELCYPNCGSGLELLVWTQQGNSCPFFCLKVLLR